MSIIIKGVKMPKNCGECHFLRPKSPYPCWCYAEGFPVKPGETDLRDGLCPLVPVPTPHGRLIDADALNYQECVCKNVHCYVCQMTDSDGNCKVENMIDKAPTVIESEE